MRIVVAGAGDLGTFLIAQLSAERHELSVIDKSAEKLERLAQKHDVATFRGNALSYDNLMEVGAAKADLFVSVTESEELNLMTAILAKRVGAKRVIARVRHSKLILHDDVFDFAGLGIDEIVSPDSLAADEVAMLLDTQAFSQLVKFEHGKYFLAGLIVPAYSTLIGHTLQQIARKYRAAGVEPIALVRDGMTYHASERLPLKETDHLYFIASSGGLHKMAKVQSGQTRRRKRAMVFGGSRAGIETTRRLQAKGYQVTMVEGKKSVAEELADFLPEALVIHGDMQESGFLEEHDVDEMDAIVAATGNPELNIISCLIAKQHGVRHTIAFVKDVHYLQGAYELGVDTLINKKYIAADFIFRHVKKRNVLSVASIPGLDMEIFEFLVKDRSPITGMPQKSIELIAKSEVVIGGVLRKNKPVELDPSYIFQPNDRVIVACHNAVRDAFQNML
ncbi:MAG: Trk system potassium transporter TrkA [Candidatus Kaiserbacteria bacterium]|nr:Trk system potassium transporter TrkA [Candidatus Kaiserbacteria bacterium]MCB9816159.1 Trk system potassium transporter TrkA [Candidatus Nomurabacteria bacterium]